jgi:hypothetical protein
MEATGVDRVATQRLPAPWRETTLLELVWTLAANLDDDAAVVGAVTNLVRQGRVRSEEGRLYQLRSASGTRLHGRGGNRS